jgi:antitoxin HigA-1
MKTTPAHVLLDTILREQGLKNDAHLARDMQIGPPQLSKIRHGLEVSDEFRVRLMRRYAMTLVRLDELAPPKNARA